MEGKRSSCPINRGVEFLGDRWSLLILRDMAFVGSHGFRELLASSQEAISPSTLSTRLKSLERAGLVSKIGAPRGRQGSYTLTEEGIQLVPLLFELAHIGSMLDPTTSSTEPRFQGWYGDAEKIAAYMDELREREGLTTPSTNTAVGSAQEPLATSRMEHQGSRDLDRVRGK